MKKYLTILLLIFNLPVCGQNCDTIENKRINCIDDSGLRQGYWELTKKNIIISGFAGLGSVVGCQFFEKAEYYPLAKGDFKDDRKIGTWEYYSGDHLELLVRKIIYHENGTIEDNNLADNYKLIISKDTLFVSGQYFHSYDTIQLICQNQLCVFSFLDEKVLINFPFTDMNALEFELLNLKFGIYDREIGIN